MRAGFQHHDGMHLLAPDLMWNTDDRHLCHRRVSGNGVLDFNGVHVLAAGDDHVGDAIDQVQVALGVEVAGIARVVPTVA